MNFKEIVQKTVIIEAKMGLKSNIIVWNLDICCPQGYRFFNNIASKVQTQRTSTKDSFYSEELKVKDPKSALLRTNTAELLKPAKKKDKQKRLRRRQKHNKKQKKTPIIDDNAINVTKKRKRDINKVIYFNYNKKSHFATTYTKSPKN